MNLEKLGWNSFFEEKFEEFKSNNQSENHYEYIAGRISAIHKTICKVLTEQGEINAVISTKIRDHLAGKGKSRYKKQELMLDPAVGDWVMLTYEPKDQKGIIRGVLPRKSRFSRNRPGSVPTTEVIAEQVIASNIDTVFIVNALNYDFNLSRIERYLTAVWDSGANPIILLNKADLCDDLEDKIDQVENVAFGVPVHVMTAINDEGIDALDKYLTGSKTCIFLGSSGVGKSTIINKILGEERLRVQQISDANEKGKHTTTHRELFVLPDGGIVIDTPGLKIVKLWSGDDHLDQIFSDVEELMTQCRFSNCRHQTEPGCAVLQAIEDGTLSEKRLRNYYKLQKELRYIQRKEAKKKDRRVKVGYKQSVKNFAKEKKRILNNQSVY